MEAIGNISLQTGNMRGIESIQDGLDNGAQEQQTEDYRQGSGH
tara:strand:- start:437 stop:565 length:129 start_codon:yes stop_codon:yes gene_type:complete